MRTVIYCGQQAKFIDSVIVYGKSYGMIWLCGPCDAYVGTHVGRDEPLGRLANKELREWKIRAHTVFDKLWNRGTMTRKAAYAHLQKLMSMTSVMCRVSQTHKFTTGAI